MIQFAGDVHDGWSVTGTGISPYWAEGHCSVCFDSLLHERAICGWCYAMVHRRCTRGRGAQYPGDANRWRWRCKRCDGTD